MEPGYLPVSRLLVTYLDPDDSDENERRAAAELADPAALSGPALAAEGR